MWAAKAVVTATRTNNFKATTVAPFTGQHLKPCVMLKKCLQTVIKTYASDAVLGRIALHLKVSCDRFNDGGVRTIKVNRRVIKPNQRGREGRDACGRQPGAAPNDNGTVR